MHRLVLCFFKFNKLASVNKFFMDTYQTILDYLYHQLPFFQRTGPPAYKSSLKNTKALDRLYGHPHRNYRTIHVAGTNGKGSVSHMLAAILQQSGMKTGLYTSPHMKDFRERIRINGKKIGKEEVIRWVEDFRRMNKKHRLEPSFFELTAALAMDFFAREQVDVAVMETGLGGRLDSTNVITPEVSIITNIGYDHTNLLGNTLEAIAREKAGIIKPGVPVVIGRHQPEIRPVFATRATRMKTSLSMAAKEFSVVSQQPGPEGKQLLTVYEKGRLVFPDLRIGLAGAYQRENVGTVLQACRILQEKGWSVPEQAIYRGLDEVVEITGIQGRWQQIGSRPVILCDSAHNEDGIRAVANQLKNTPCKRLHVVFGIVKDKETEKILRWLPGEGIYYFTRADIPRAMDEKVLTDTAIKAGLQGASYPTVREALNAARKNAGDEDLIFVGGSTFVVAEILP